MEGRFHPVRLKRARRRRDVYARQHFMHHADHRWLLMLHKGTHCTMKVIHR